MIRKFLCFINCASCHARISFPSPQSQAGRLLFLSSTRALGLRTTHMLCGFRPRWGAGRCMRPAGAAIRCCPAYDALPPAPALRRCGALAVVPCSAPTKPRHGQSHSIVCIGASLPTAVDSLHQVAAPRRHCSPPYPRGCQGRQVSPEDFDSVQLLQTARSASPRTRLQRCPAPLHGQVPQLFFSVRYSLMQFQIWSGTSFCHVNVSYLT
jgi:hypothetical protein